MLDLFFYFFFKVFRIWDPLKNTHFGREWTFMTTGCFIAEVKGQRFEVHTCLDVHSCSRAVRVSSVHAAFQTDLD